MKNSIFILLIVCINSFNLQAQTIYVDSHIGDDNNPGTKSAPFASIHKAAALIKASDNDIQTVKINPGTYVLDSVLTITSDKSLDNQRIIIEAAILPDDTAWTPEKMPVIISNARKGEIAEYYNFVAAFLVDASHVTIRGLKFPGYFYPNTRYFPIARFNLERTDLLVEQCMFVGDRHASHIQVAIIADGNGIKLNHCVFHNAKNAVVYWRSKDNLPKTGNSFTNNIVYGAFQTAIWTAAPDKDFVCKNNVILNGKHFWIRNADNNTEYTIEDCVILDNKHYQGVPVENGVQPMPFIMNEKNIIKDGNATLRMNQDNVDMDLPHDYLHLVPGSEGDDLNAGLFKNPGH